mgnify:CR=1 FL=1
MNINKFTQKSIEAIQELEKLAYEFGNQEMDQEHLVYALVNQSDGLIGKMIDKMEINLDHFKKRIVDFIEKKPKVQGGELRVSNDLNKVLVTAENEAKAMGDEYVSVEHLFLTLIKNPNRAMKEFFGEYSLAKYRFIIDTIGFGEFGNGMTWSELKNYQIMMKTALDEYNATHTSPLKDENGQLVEF